MSRRRPLTAGSVRSTSVVGALRVRPCSRPGSARELFEAYNQRRNEEAWRMEEWKNTVNLYKKREWQAQYYNVIAQPRQKISDEEERRRKEEKERNLANRRTRLKKLFQEDEKKYQEEREQNYNESRGRTVHRHFVYPEVEMLKYRLDDLKKKNQEERRKMSEALSYEVWRKNSPQVRQMESDRLNHFVQEAWVNQRQWKEDEKQRRLEDDRKKEIEAAAIQQHLEEEDQRAEEEKQKRQAKWKLELEAQVELIKERERRDGTLRAEELTLERERLRLHEINQRRERMKELRQRKELELFWARQYQLKLKKKAADIQQELLEDESIVEELRRGLTDEDADEQVKQRRGEAEWMKTVLREQRYLEIMREKEYELLFSEEAEKLWRKRQAEWDKEQRARDKLMADVIRGLQQQVQDNLSKNVRERKLLDAEQNEIQRSIIETRDKMQQLEEQEADRRRTQRCVSAISQPSTRIIQEAANLRRNQEEEEQKFKEHRQEIERLENQMQQLWGPQYAPPRYGRKRFAW